MVLKEFLVALGLQDNMSSKLDESLKKADQSTTKFAGAFAKRFVLAGVAVTTFVATASVGLAKFAMQLDKSDRELETFAKKIGQPKEEAYKTKTALDVMGKSMEEVKLDPKLLEQFKELKANAASLKMPDLSEGLKPVREFQTSFLALKQTAANALQWVGFHFLKYVARPLEDIQNRLKSFNETIQKNIPSWSDKVGKALSWIVQLAATIIRAGAQMLGAINKVFHAIPDGVKVAMAALAILGAFIKAGPIGKLVMIFTALLLLLDDFYTYLDGGDSLLGPVWKTLIDIFHEFEKYIPDIQKAFEKLGKIAADVFATAVQWVSGFIDKLKENGAIENFKTAFGKAGKAIKDILDTVVLVIEKVLDMVGGGDAVKIFFAYLTGMALPGIISFVSEAVSHLSDFVEWLDKIGALEPVIASVAGAFGLFITVSKARSFIKAFTGSITDVTKKIDLMKKGLESGSSIIGNFGSSIKNLGKSVSGLVSAIGKQIAANAKNGAMWVANTAKLVAHKTASLAMAAAQKAVTAAQWLLNAAMSANPIGLVIAAIVALIAIFALLWKNNEGFRNFFIDLCEKVKNGFQAVVDFFGPAIEHIIAYFEPVLSAFERIFGGVIKFFKGIFTGDFKGAWDGIKDIFGGVSDYFKAIIDKVIGFFQPLLDVFGKVGDFAKNTLGKVGEAVKGFFGGGGKGKETGHAEGGVFDQEHYARFAEGNKAEAVIPLTKPKRAAEVMREAADYMTGLV
ncbi:MAG: hypothetical protein ACK5H4_09175, partial [Lacrimispora sphenoides]